MLIGRADDPQSPCRVVADKAALSVWEGIAEPIWASGHVRTKQAGHTNALAPDQSPIPKNLDIGGPSTHALLAGYQHPSLSVWSVGKSTMDLHPIPKRLAPAGFCIYCGVTKDQKALTKEHIIPFSLGGILELPNASCLSCADITKKIEQYAGRSVFQDVRIEHRLPTRRPKERPTELPLRESFFPSPETAPIRLVPTKNYPGMLFLVNPEPPGILAGRPINSDPKIAMFVKTLSGRSRILRLKKRGAPALLYRELRPEIIMRLIAKISLGHAVAGHGQDSFDSTEIRKIILDPNIFPYHLIGGTTAGMVEFPPNSSPWALHRVAGFLQFIGDVPYLLYQVQLFAYLGAPIFTTVVGKLTQTGIDKFIAEKNIGHAK